MSNKAKPKWTRDLPAETGAYFVRNRGGATFWAHYTAGMPFVRLFGEIVRVSVKFITHWYGPIAEPDAPREDE